MRIKEISYLGPITDLIYTSIDVFVFLEDERCNDEFCYVVHVTTPQFLSSRIEKSGSNFLGPNYPYIILSKLTDEIIKEALQSFVDIKEDSYWLKLYHITPRLATEDINEILDRKKQEKIEL
jgi:hypothetical protein